MNRAMCTMGRAIVEREHMGCCKRKGTREEERACGGLDWDGEGARGCLGNGGSRKGNRIPDRKGNRILGEKVKTCSFY